ncbi:hypothetical protein RB601_005380 [Gaeumannomyces tritici]
MFSVTKTVIFVLAAGLANAVPFDAVDSVTVDPAALASGEVLRRANGCGAAGIVNGECGRYYRGDSCSDLIGNIKPDCKKGCHTVEDGLRSIKATGNGIYGTNCALFEDKNCQRQLGETGNAIFAGGEKCYTVSDNKKARMAYSYKCYYRC